MLDEKGNLKPGELTALMAEKAERELDGFTADLLLREAYETDFGILDHRLKENQTPLSIVRMNPKEDPSSYSRLFETLRRYVKYDIHEHFGYTPDQFLELPREIVAFLFQLAVEKAETKGRTVDTVLKELEAQASGKGGNKS